MLKSYLPPAAQEQLDKLKLAMGKYAKHLPTDGIVEFEEKNSAKHLWESYPAGVSRYNDGISLPRKHPVDSLSTFIWKDAQGNVTHRAEIYNNYSLRQTGWQSIAMNGERAQSYCAQERTLVPGFSAAHETAMIELDKEGILQHRAITGEDGVTVHEYFKDGKLNNRENGRPAVSSSDGRTIKYAENGKLHRLDGPALIRDNDGEDIPSVKRYYIEGVEFSYADFKAHPLHVSFFDKIRQGAQKCSLSSIFPTIAKKMKAEDQPNTKVQPNISPVQKPNKSGLKM